jgi:ATP-dependent helicase HrpB
VLQEARSVSRRLRKAWGLKERAGKGAKIERNLLVSAALRSDSRCAYVARRRKGKVFWGNGGTEIALARESAVNEEKTDAVVVLASMAVGMGYRNRKLFGTCAVPVKFRDLFEAGLGEDRIAHVARVKAGVVTARIERVYAGRAIEQREDVPRGLLARLAVKSLFLEGRLHRASRDETQQRLEAASLLRRLVQAGLADKDMDTGALDLADPVPALEDWAEARLASLGVESGEDLALLSAADFLAAELPESTLAWLDSHFKRALRLGNADYDVEYDLSKKEVTLVKTGGAQKEPPSLSTLPSFRGFRIRVRHHSKVWVLRR